MEVDWKQVGRMSNTPAREDEKLSQADVSGKERG